MEPTPPLPGSPSSHLPSSPDFSASTSEDELAVQDVSGQHPPLPYPRWGVAQLYRSLQREKQWIGTYYSRIHSSSEFCSCSSRNGYSAGFGDKSLLPRVFVPVWRRNFFATWRDWSRNICFFGCDIANGTYSSRQTEGLLDEIGAGLLHILRTNNGTLKISHTSFSAFYGQ